MRLTKKDCDGLLPKAKSYKKFDGGGLYIEVLPSGKKYWRLKYYFLGKEKRFSFGRYPIVTLKQAREKRLEARKLLDQGVDPSRNRISEQQLSKRAQYNTFELVAREWYKNQLHRWSKGRAKYVINCLERNVFPYIGKVPISTIESPDLLKTLRIIEKRGALYVASRTRQICSQVFRYGIQTGRCKINPADSIIGALRLHKKTHFAALDAKELPEFLTDLRQNRARLYVQTIKAVKFSLYTFARPGEVRHCKWDHIDLDERQWLIPGENMKSGRDHIIPLSSQVISILREQYQDIGSMNTPWVFPGQRRHSKPMSDGTVNMAIKRLGYAGRMTAHGFRALARTTIREKLKYYPDVIEAQLAHKPSGPLGAAYDRAQFLDERTKMMQDWADWIDGLLLNR